MAELCPEIGRSNWVDRCALQLGRLLPDVPIDEVCLVAESLWFDDHGVTPEHAAEREVLTWSHQPS